jgi:hypothetical protein
MIGTDNSVRKAYVSTRPSAAQCANKDSAQNATPAFSVVPTTISACDERAQFRVTGVSLPASKEDYTFGVIAAASVGGPIGGNLAESRAVTFTGLQSANRGRDRIEFTMAAPDGSTRVAYIGVDGSAGAASCATPKATPKAAGANPAKAAAIILAPPGRQPADASDLCALPPLQMVVTGDKSTSIQSANILGGEYPGIVDTRSDGKSTIVTLIFPKLPNFKNEMPGDDILRVNLTLRGPKPGAITKVSIDRPVTCGSSP